MFSSLRQGSLVYIINIKNKLTVNNAQLIETTATDFNNGYFPTQGNNLINIKVNVEGAERSFGNLPGGQSVASYDGGSTIITDSRDIAIAEINNIIKKSEARLANREYDEAILIDGKEALKMLNPQYAEEKKREEEIANINKRIDDIGSKFDKLIDALSKHENK